jgi:hypothetical protein
MKKIITNNPTKLLQKWERYMRGLSVSEVVHLLFDEIVGVKVKKLLKHVQIESPQQQEAIGQFINNLNVKNKRVFFAKQKPFISVAQLQLLLSRFKVTHYDDVHNSETRHQMRIIINFIYYGRFEIRPSRASNAGYGLFALSTVDFDTTITTYGGRWLSDNTEQEGELPRIANRYLLELPFHPYLRQKGWVLDGEAFFRLKDLGRWINHPPKNRRATVTWKFNDTISLEEWLSSGMTLNIVGQTQKGAEIYMNYGENSPMETFPNYANMPNVQVVQNNLVATHTIFPGENIKLELVPPAEPLPAPGQKRNLGVESLIVDVSKMTI